MLLALQKRQVLLWKRLGPMGSVQSSRWDEPIFLMIPGTSCLATIVLSLRDKTIRPSKRLAIILALNGLRPWVRSWLVARYRLEAYATLLSGLAREVWKSSSKRLFVPASNRDGVILIGRCLLLKLAE
jgi:hypothetical protein